MSPEAASRISVVLGSATPPGRLRRSLEGAIQRSQQRGVGAELLDLAEWRLSFADGRDLAELDDDTGTVVAAVAAAPALIVATPVYRGSLKNLFDLLPVPALRGKVVGIVAMGASDHHYLGAERHLRDVLAFFGAQAMPVAVYLTGADFEDGAVGERGAEALDQLFSGLVLTAAALGATAAPAGPPPMAARAIRPPLPTPAAP